MKNPLRKRLLRDLKNNIGRYTAIALMLIATIAMMSAFLSVADKAKKTLYDNKINCKLEDGLFSASNEINNSIIAKTEKLGVRIYNNYYLNEKISKKNTLRIYSDRKKVDIVTIMKGKKPANPHEIAVDRLYAESNKMDVGEEIKVQGSKMKITGFICAPDYTSLFQNNSDLMMDSFHFGIAIVNKNTFTHFQKNKITNNYSYYFNKRNLSEKEKRKLSDHIRKCLVENGALLTNFCTAENNQSISFVEDDMGSDVPMVKVLLYIIIGIMAFVFAIIIASTIEEEAVIIGTLLASGYGKNELVRHYLSMPIIITLFSAVIGNILGYTAMTGIFKGMYYGSYSLAPIEVKLNLEALLLTTVLPIVIMIVINFAALSSKLSISPLNFLRRELKKKKNKNKKALKLPNVSFLSRFRMRVIIQNKSSYIMLFIGAFLASLILMFGLCMKPLITHYVDSIKKSVASDYQYILKAPKEPKKAGDTEKFSFSSLETYYKPIDKNLEVSFYGLHKNSKYFSRISIPEIEKGTYFSDGLAKKLNVEKGDIVTFVNPYTDKKYKIKVIGVYDYPSGLTAFMNQKQMNRLFGYQNEYFNGYFSDKKLNFPDKNYLASVITPEDMIKLGDQMMSSFEQMAPICLGIAIIIYLVLMYVLTKIVIDRNAICISYLKVFGYEQNEIRKLYLRSTTIAILISLIIGLPLVYLGIQGCFKAALMKVSGYIPIYIPNYLYAVVLVTGMVSYFIINFFHIKRINKIEMSVALKGRE